MLVKRDTNLTPNEVAKILFLLTEKSIQGDEQQRHEYANSIIDLSDYIIDAINEYLTVKSVCASVIAGALIDAGRTFVLSYMQENLQDLIDS